ncbi:hypothetical protein TNCV_3346101 [Trichonephila clavipes]|nr:hypothetical protein TNCV_3346101 [Trichonephila clavipes]
MNGHEANRSAEQANGNSSRDPDAVTCPEKIESLPPNVHCARIRTLQKLIRYAETRIRYQQELIDIETFDQRDTDAAQLQSYIHAKRATELDYNMKLETNDITQPKVKPIMLRYKNNFNLILQHLNRKYPDSVNKLTGEYIKITAASIDQHGEITKELKEKGEEFYAVPSPGDRPLKMVLKGLPSNSDIDDIKK